MAPSEPHCLALLPPCSLCTYCMKIGLCDQQNSMGMNLQEVIGILQICLSVWDHLLWGSCQVMSRPLGKELRFPANNHMSDLTSKSFSPGRIQMIDNPAKIWTATPLETPGQSTPGKSFHNFWLIKFFINFYIKFYKFIIFNKKTSPSQASTIHEPWTSRCSNWF